MNNWRSRLMTAVVLGCAMWVHSSITSALPNDPLGMLAFHGSAALFDFFLIICMPQLVEGRLCDDMQVLCLVSMCANFIGWIAYMAYLSPVFYNAFQLGLSLVQGFRLLITDGDNAHNNQRVHLVRGPDQLGA